MRQRISQKTFLNLHKRKLEPSLLPSKEFITIGIPIFFEVPKTFLYISKALSIVMASKNLCTQESITN